jgi:hypothetical protein
MKTKEEQGGHSWHLVSQVVSHGWIVGKLHIFGFGANVDRKPQKAISFGWKRQMSSR